MLKFFTKEKALILSEDTLILSGLVEDDETINININTEIRRLCRENITFVTNIKDCDYCVLPYMITDFEDAIYEAFYDLAMKHNKVLVCFGKIDDDVPNNVKMIKNSDVKQTIDYLRNVPKPKPKLTWSVINAYRCHVPGANNHFINDDYDIDTYCFLKKTLSKFCDLTAVDAYDSHDIVLSSIYGLAKPTGKCKIFFNGESKQLCVYYSNVERILKEYDYYIGFDVPKVSYRDRMFRLPYWMCMFDFYKDDSKYLERINQCSKGYSSNLEGVFPKRSNNCVMISTTDFNSLRSSFVACCFQKNIQVHCPSKICHNTDYMPVGREGKGTEHFFHGKLEYLKQFKIEICFENTNEYGYVTEKIFGALMSGCIPVYWGSSFEGLIENDIINMDRVLYLDQNLSNFEEIIGQLHRLTNDEDYYNGFFNKPIFKTNAREILKKHLEKFDSFVKHMWCLSPKD